MGDAFTPDEVAEWDVDSVAGWLNIIGFSDLVDLFRDNDITGVVLLDLDEDILGELEVPDDQWADLLKAIGELTSGSGDGAALPTAPLDSDSEGEDAEDDDGIDPGQPEPAAPAAAAAETVAPLPSPGAPKPQLVTRMSSSLLTKKKDPLRIAAHSKAVADLASCAVTSGWLYKIGGSGLKPKHWKRRYFVLTDDNCLYYFKSPKDMSALGLILLPTYTITIVDKSENIGNRPFAFKAFNRNATGARKYILAAESEKEMKTWMNVMSLASIAFGTGQAAMSKADASVPQLTDDNDADLLLMQRRAEERAGGVTATDAPVKKPFGGVPSFVKKSQARSKTKGRTLCLVEMLDGTVTQLYAEPTSTARDFFTQICTILNAQERYYFGLQYTDVKGDEEWMQLDKKVLKHDFPKGDHLEIKFRIRYYPMDVTQVLQYVTLYQVFLAAKKAIVGNELEISNKDAMTLASLALQATRGDFDESKVTPALLAADEQLLPRRNMDDIMGEMETPPANADVFFAEEVIRVWKSLQGILRHLAVLKYMQIVQKHKRFAMQFYDIKNKKGTPLVLGISPHGLYIFRLGRMQKAIVTFSWSECSELSFTEKKFTIQVHDKETKGFSVYCSKPKVCQKVLYLCIGLHRLYVQTIRQWADAPAELQAMRKLAIQAALQEREKLKQEAIEVRKKAKQLQKKTKPAAAPAAAPAPTPAPAPAAAAPPAAAPAAAAASPSDMVETDKGETVYIKGRDEAVQMMDLMMADEEFMKFQEDMLADFEVNLEDELVESGRMRAMSFAKTVDSSRAADSRPVGARVDAFDGESH